MHARVYPHLGTHSVSVAASSFLVLIALSLTLAAFYHCIGCAIMHFLSYHFLHFLFLERQNVSLLLKCIFAVCTCVILPAWFMCIIPHQNAAPSDWKVRNSLSLHNHTALYMCVVLTWVRYLVCSYDWHGLGKEEKLPPILLMCSIFCTLLLVHYLTDTSCTCCLVCVFVLYQARGYTGDLSRGMPDTIEVIYGKECYACQRKWLFSPSLLCSFKFPSLLWVLWLDVEESTLWIYKTLVEWGCSFRMVCVMLC